MFLAKQSFGKFEDGNKIYFDHMEEYFSQMEIFKQKGMSFKKDIVPQLRVKNNRIQLKKLKKENLTKFKKSKLPHFTQFRLNKSPKEALSATPKSITPKNT